MASSAKSGGAGMGDADSSSVCSAIRAIFDSHGVADIPHPISESLDQLESASSHEAALESLSLESLVEAITSCVLAEPLGVGDVDELACILDVYQCLAIRYCGESGPGDQPQPIHAAAATSEEGPCCNIKVLQPLLVCAGGRLPTGITGLHRALRLLGGAGDRRTLSLLASSLRAHLADCPVDAVFSFPPVHEEVVVVSNGGGMPGAGSAHVGRPRIDLPSTFDWSAFRGYTFVMWLRVGPESFAYGGGDDAVLFSFRMMAGQGVDARLSRRQLADGSSGSSGGGGYTHSVTVTTYNRSGKPLRSVACDALDELSGDDGARWRLLSVSHTLPYVKRSVVKVALDARVRCAAELVYPGAPDGAMPRSVLCEGLVGDVAAAALFEDELPPLVLRALLAAGPNHLAGALPLYVPRAPREALQTAATKGRGAAAAAEATLIWALLPSAVAPGSTTCVELKQIGTPHMHYTDLASPAQSVQRGAGGGGSWSVARLSYGTRVVRPYQDMRAPRAPQLALKTGSGGGGGGGGGVGRGIHDVWLRAGGVRALLYAAGGVIDCALDAAAAAAPGRLPADLVPGTSALLAEILALLALLLEAHPAHREEMLTAHGFHLACAALQRLAEPLPLRAALDHRVLGACLSLLHAAAQHDALAPEGAGGSGGGGELVGAALQGLMLDFRLWGSAAPAVRVALLRGVQAVVCGSGDGGAGAAEDGRFAPALRRYVGVQRLLDVLRVHVCTDIGGDAAGAASAAASAGMQESVDALQAMLLAMLNCGLTAGDGLTPVQQLRSPSPVLEDGTLGPEAAAAAAAANSSSPTPRVSADLKAIVACLHESRSATLVGALLGVLLRLRALQPVALRRGLALCGYASTAAPALLAPPVGARGPRGSAVGGAGGGSVGGRHLSVPTVKRDALALLLWLIHEGKRHNEDDLLNTCDPPAGAAATAHAPQSPGGTAVASPERAPRSPPAAKPLQSVASFSSALDASGGGGGGSGGTDSAGTDVISTSPYLHLALARAIAACVLAGGWGTGAGIAAGADTAVGMDIADVLLGEGEWAMPAHVPGAGPNPATAPTHIVPLPVPLWLALPFAAAVLPSPWLPPSARARIVTAINMSVKQEVGARRQLLKMSAPVWAEALLELALADYDRLPVRAAGTAAEAAASAAAAAAAGAAALDSPGEWEDVHAFGTGAVSAPLVPSAPPASPATSAAPAAAAAAPHAGICEELALDALGFMIAEVMCAHPQGFRLWHHLLPCIDAAAAAATQAAASSAAAAEWAAGALARLVSIAMRRALRGRLATQQWTALTLDTVCKLLVLTEERLLPCARSSGGGAAFAATPAVTAGGTSAAASTPDLLTPSEPVSTAGASPAVVVLTPTLWGLVECLLEAAETLRQLLQRALERQVQLPLPQQQQQGAPPHGPGGSGGGGEDLAPAALAAKAQGAVRIVVSVLTAALATAGMSAGQATRVAQEAIVSMQLYVACPPGVVAASAAREAVLAALLGLRRAIAACDAEAYGTRGGEGASFAVVAATAAAAAERKSLLEAVTMDLVHRLCLSLDDGTSGADFAAAPPPPPSPPLRHRQRHRHRGDEAAAATPAVPGSRAVAALLAPAHECITVTGIFEALGAALASCEMEASEDLKDIVQLSLFSTSPAAVSFASDAAPAAALPSASQAAAAAAAAAPAAARVRSGSSTSTSLLCRGSAGDAWLAQRLALHKARADRDRRRLGAAMASLDAAADVCWRAWVRMSRQAEAEQDASLPLARAPPPRARRAAWDPSQPPAPAPSASRLTGLHRGCQWKLACAGELEGHEPARLRATLVPVVGVQPQEALIKVRERAHALQLTAFPPGGGGGAAAAAAAARRSALSSEELGTQLARKCSQYIVDITKSESIMSLEGADGLDDAAASEEGEGQDATDEELWGVVNRLSYREDDDADDLLSSSSAAAAAAPRPLRAGSGGEEELAVVDEPADDARRQGARAREEAIQEVHEELVGASGDIAGASPGASADGAAAAHPSAGPADLGPTATALPPAVAEALAAPPGGGGGGNMNGGTGAYAVTLVRPKRNVRGRVLVVAKALFFVPDGAAARGGGGGGGDGVAAAGNGGGGVTDEADTAHIPAAKAKVRQWPLAHVCAVYTRRYRLVDSAMEVFLRRGTKRGLFLDFGVTKGDVDRRNEFVRMLVRFCPRGTLKHWPTEARRLQRLWQGRRISNFDYLMGLNTLAGRSYSDLCQYPVFPWVLSCYSAPALDLGDPACYRDLSRPIGALDDARLAEFLERYESFQDPDIPAFMYGSHYSTAVGVVLHFLLRLQPFADLHQSMQNGAFDVPDRLFSSVPRAWALCTSALSEVKELTPEWYCVPDFLRNVNGFALGATQDGERVDDVALPRWAASPEDFIRKHRAALESEHVSENLHHWIDLIFGHKQQGQAAVDAHNVFYYLTYYGAIDLTKIRDDALRRATELQIAHFGQCPMQLFSRPHPPRGRRVLVPRPLATTTQGLDLWRQEALDAGKRMSASMEPLAARGGTRALRVLPNSKLIVVNGRGLVEIYRFAWADADARERRDAAATAAAAAAAEPAPRGSGSSSAGGSSFSGSPASGHGMIVPFAGGEGTSAGAGAGTGAGLSGLELQRVIAPFDVVPRILLPSAPHAHAGSAHASAVAAAPVLISRSGALIFSGGHPSGAVLMWAIDAETGAVTGEAALQGHTASVTCLAACGLEASGADVLLSGSADGTAALWALRRLASARPFHTPRADRAPLQVLRGHGAPLTACAIDDSLGLALTTSANHALLHCIERPALLRAIRPPRCAAAGSHGSNAGSHDGGGGSCGAASSSGSAHALCGAALSALGYVVLASNAGDGSESALCTYTVNGALVAELVQRGCAVRHVAVAGRAECVVAAFAAAGVSAAPLPQHRPLQVRAVVDLSLLWALPPERIPYGPPPPPSTLSSSRASASYSAAASVDCVELGPSADAPVVAALGMADGGVCLLALPDAEDWLRRQAPGAVGALIGAPVKMVLGTVQTAQSIAVRAARGVGGVVRAGGGIAREVLPAPLVRGVQKTGLVRGLVGYLKGGGGGGGGGGAADDRLDG